MLQGVQRRVTRKFKRLEDVFSDKRLKELGLISLKKGRLWGDLPAAFQYLAVTRTVGEGLFTRIYSVRIWRNGFELEKGRNSLL